jgi:UDPglucose 6-dehydrogenase
VLVLTEWREFVDLDPHDLATTVRAKVVVDGRNCLDIDRWNSAGWRVYALGRSAESVNQQTLA